VVVLIGGEPVPALSDVAPALAAGVAQLVGIAALYRALALGTMSVISPISASGAAALPVIVGIAGGERLVANPGRRCVSGARRRRADRGRVTRGFDESQPGRYRAGTDR
jgi:hypothetical protein